MHITTIMSLSRTNLEPPWLQEAVFDDVVYELDTSRNIAVRNSEKSLAKKLQRSISLAVSNMAGISLFFVAICGY